MQALEVIRTLQDNIPLQRASMKLRLTLPAREARRVREKILPHLTIQHEEWDNQELNIVSSRNPILALVCACVWPLCLYIGVSDGPRLLPSCGGGG